MKGAIFAVPTGPTFLGLERLSGGENYTRRVRQLRCLVPVEMHPDQLVIEVETVQAMVSEQFPAWAKWPIRRVASEGTVNAIFRLGDGLVARFPLQGDSPSGTLRQLEAEAAAAGELSGKTPFPTPQTIAIGRPGKGYSLPWSVQTWLAGTVASENDPGRSVAFAHDLARFITGVRAIDTRGRVFSGTGRGGDLRSHDEWMSKCFAHSDGLLEVRRLREMWGALRELPREEGDLMTHGDLVPGNVLVREGRLAGVLDVGGLAAADPALDLVGAWHLLEASPREALRKDLNCGDLEWERGKAWAFEQAMGLPWYYATSNATMAAIGRRTLDRLLEDGG
jgi:aminoglycoside phosphotransferase (APT) family kinase protein